MEESRSSFLRVLNGYQGSWNPITRGSHSFLEHDVTTLSGDLLLDRLILLADNGWLNEAVHKFCVDGKVIFKVKVKDKTAELDEIYGRKSRKWSKDFRKVLETLFDCFGNFLTRSLQQVGNFDGNDFHACISLLFEIARNEASACSSFPRQSVARAIQVTLNSKNSEDIDDLIKVFSQEGEGKLKWFLMIMCRNNKLDYLKQHLGAESKNSEKDSEKVKREKPADDSTEIDDNSSSSSRDTPCKPFRSEDESEGMPTPEKEALTESCSKSHEEAAIAPRASDGTKCQALASSPKSESESQSCSGGKLAKFQPLQTMERKVLVKVKSPKTSEITTGKKAQNQKLSTQAFSALSAPVAQAFELPSTPNKLHEMSETSRPNAHNSKLPENNINESGGAHESNRRPSGPTADKRQEKRHSTKHRLSTSQVEKQRLRQELACEPVSRPEANVVQSTVPRQVPCQEQCSRNSQKESVRTLSSKPPGVATVEQGHDSKKRKSSDHKNHKDRSSKVVENASSSADNRIFASARTNQTHSTAGCPQLNATSRADDYVTNQLLYCGKAQTARDSVASSPTAAPLSSQHEEAKRIFGELLSLAQANDFSTNTITSCLSPGGLGMTSRLERTCAAILNAANSNLETKTCSIASLLTGKSHGNFSSKQGATSNDFHGSNKHPLVQLHSKQSKPQSSRVNLGGDSQRAGMPQYSHSKHMTSQKQLPDNDIRDTRVEHSHAATKVVSRKRDSTRCAQNEPEAKKPLGDKPFVVLSGGAGAQAKKRQLGHNSSELVHNTIVTSEYIAPLQTATAPSASPVPWLQVPRKRRVNKEPMPDQTLGPFLVASQTPQQQSTHINAFSQLSEGDIARLLGEDLPAHEEMLRRAYPRLQPKH